MSFLNTRDAPIVIGAVIYARRTVKVFARSRADAEVQLTLFQRFLQFVGLRAAVNLAQGDQVEIVADGVVPVAYQPLFAATIADTGWPIRVQVNFEPGSDSFRRAFLDQIGVED